jgi:hypothetical protein
MGEDVKGEATLKRKYVFMWVPLLNTFFLSDNSR